MLFASLPLLALAAGDAVAQRSLTPGQFFTGLTESGAEAIVAQAQEAFPGVMVMPSYDVGLCTWTVDLRDAIASGAETPAE